MTPTCQAPEVRIFLSRASPRYCLDRQDLPRAGSRIARRRWRAGDDREEGISHATRLTLPHDRRSLVCRAPLGLQRAAGLAESRWPAKRSLGFFFCFRDTAGRCARLGIAGAGLGACLAGKRGAAIRRRRPQGGCCCDPRDFRGGALVVLEGYSMGLQGGVGSERFTRRSHSSLESHILLLRVPMGPLAYFAFVFLAG